MKIELIRAFNGANVYSHEPVVMIELDLEELKGKRNREISGFNAGLLERLPKLYEYDCRANKPGGFVERLHKGTHFNHVVEHVAMELLTLAGFDHRGKLCQADKKHDSKAVIEPTMFETARYLLPVF